MPRLIVNADDFGYTPGINQAVLALHCAAALRSTTLMASGGAFADAVAHARPHATLGVGCHVVLVDGTPSLPAEQVRTLLDPGFEVDRPRGILPRFRPTLAAFVRDLTRGRIDTRELEAEAAAQMARLQDSGVAVTHVDTHKHTHMFPRVLRPLVRAALGRGIHAIRNPFEPAWALRATRGAPLVRRLEVQALALFRSEFLRTTEAAGLHTPAGSLGVLATGTLDAPTLRTLLATIPRGEQTWELVCHPGHADHELAALPTRLQGQRAVEYAALAQVLPGAGIEQVHFGDL